MRPLSEEASYQIRRGEAVLAKREERRRAYHAAALRAATVLKAEFGATRVWLFGSLRRPWFHEASDVDLAVEGIAGDQHGIAWDRALEVAETSLDLVFLEEAPALLRERILADGELLLEST